MVRRVLILRWLAAALWLVLPLLGAFPIAANDGLQITTAYPAVAVEAGETATFPLVVTAPTQRRVGLAVTEVPEGWSAELRGGGFLVDGVFAGPEPPDLQLEVDVPPEAAQGVHRVIVAATSGGAGHPLTLQLRVAEAVAGGITLAAEFPSLRGSSDQSFSFNLDLTNETPEETTFSLEAAAVAEDAEGWVVEARPAGEQLASTATVAGGETGGITVEVDPPDDVPAGTYPILVRAVGGGQSAEAELAVEITGNFSMVLTTPDQRLNAQVTAGGSTQLPLVIGNDGTAPLIGVELTATPPTGWEVTFEPEIVPEVAPNESAQVTATITPAGDAVAGDYVVPISAAVPEVTQEVQIRTSVETSPLWGVVGLVLIAAALVGLGWVFRRYGRR